jgi:glutathione peroxidase
MLSRLFGVRSSCYTRVFASAMSGDGTIYSFRAKNIDGQEVSLDKYRGKVLIIINTASECRYTDSNYSQLKELLEKYKQKGLEVAAFPCNQFGAQEPGCDAGKLSFRNSYNFLRLDIKAFVKVGSLDE